GVGPGRRRHRGRLRARTRGPRVPQQGAGAARGRPRRPPHDRSEAGSAVTPCATWIERDVVVARGPDTLAFLQGQLSQDVDMPVGDSRWSLLLQPTGKVDAWLRVTR